MLRSIISFFTMVFGLQATWLSFDGTPTPTPPTINIMQNDNQVVLLNIRIHGIISTDTIIDGITYSQLTLPSATRTADTGKAEMPAMKSIIQIQPISGTVISTTTLAETLIANYNIFPAQIPASDSGPIPPFI